MDYQSDITIFDHIGIPMGSETVADTIIRAAGQLNIRANAVTYQGDIEGEIAFVHPRSEEKWQEVLSSAKNGQVRIRMSSVGRPGNDSPIQRANGVWDLDLLPPPQALSEVDWMLILKGIVNEKTRNEFLEGGNAEGLRKYFVVGPREYLLALVILSQGYLAAHASYQGHDKDWNEADLEPALRQMGWLSLGEETREKHCSVLGEKKDVVRRPEWWLTGFGLWDDASGRHICEDTKWREFNRKLGLEWKQLGGKALPQEILTLLDLLVEVDEIGPPIRVALAYCAIATRLGG